MVIICAGPDMYRARQKAKELEKAFRFKFDSIGYSTVIDPFLAPEVLALQLGTASLFGSRKFFRRDYLFREGSSASLKVLVKHLSGDQDQNIIVTLEDLPLDLKTTKSLEGLKVVTYAHPRLEGVAFEAWCVSEAVRFGVSDEKAKQIAKFADGDSWLAVQELIKIGANSGLMLPKIQQETSGVFEVADTYLRSGTWRKKMSLLEESPLPILANQSRALLRVRDGVMQGVHPMVVKKWQNRIPPEAISRLRLISLALVAQRQYLALEEELECLL